MDSAAFIAAHAEYDRITPVFTNEQTRRAKELRETMIEAAAPEHVARVEEVSYMSDQCICSCGWRSDRFWDGAGYAHGQWIKHVFADITEPY